MFLFFILFVKKQPIDNIFSRPSNQGQVVSTSRVIVAINNNNKKKLFSSNENRKQSMYTIERQLQLFCQELNHL